MKSTSCVYKNGKKRDTQTHTHKFGEECKVNMIRQGIHHTRGKRRMWEWWRGFPKNVEFNISFSFHAVIDPTDFSFTVMLRQKLTKAL